MTHNVKWYTDIEIADAVQRWERIPTQFVALADYQAQQSRLTQAEGDRDRLRIQLERASGALMDAGSVPTEDVEAGIRALTTDLTTCRAKLSAILTGNGTHTVDADHAQALARAKAEVWREMATECFRYSECFEERCKNELMRLVQYCDKEK